MDFGLVAKTAIVTGGALVIGRGIMATKVITGFIIVFVRMVSNSIVFLVQAHTGRGMKAVMEEIL